MDDSPLYPETLQKIGRNVVELQKMEGMLKALLKLIEFEGEVSELKDRETKRHAAVSKQTMGTVTGELIDKMFSEWVEPSPPPGKVKHWVSLQHKMESSKEYIDNIKQSFKDEIEERNQLIHHRLLKLEADSDASCTDLISYLDAQHRRLVPLQEFLRKQLKSIREMRVLVSGVLKKSLPTLPGFEIAACRITGPNPSHEMGWSRISEHRLALWIMRASSKICRQQVNERLQRELPKQSPKTLLASLNEELCRDYPDASGCTEICVMLVDTEGYTLTSVKAGDFGPVVRTVDNQVLTENDFDDNLCLGIVPSVEYVSNTDTLKPETSLVWISPYTSQIQNSSGELYGKQRVRDQIQQAPADAQSIAESLTKDIKQFIGDREQSEDICMICLRCVE